MATFNSRLWIVPDRLSEVGVSVDIDQERIRIVSNGILIGDWALADVTMEYRDHDVHLFAEGEELVVWSIEPGFVEAMLRANDHRRSDFGQDQVAAGRHGHGPRPRHVRRR